MILKPMNDPKPMLPDCASRQTGKAVLLDIINRHRRRADDLQALVEMLPDKLTTQQDDALWGIACSLERP